MSKFKIMAFRENGDGSLTSIVARKDLFKNKENFLRYCLTENEDMDIHFEGFDNIPFYTINAVKEGYVRYYPHFPEDMSMGIESGYTFCDKGKGAIAVYSLDLDGEVED